MVSLHHACIYMFQVILVRNVIMDITMNRFTIYIAFACLLNGPLAGNVPLIYSCIKCIILQMLIVRTNIKSGPLSHCGCEKDLLVSPGKAYNLVAEHMYAG